MGYDLLPNNQESEGFHFGAFSWLVLLEAFGYLFPEVHKWGRYHYVQGLDERHNSGTLGSNDGFLVTDEEAKIMARMAKNFTAIQQSLPRQDEEVDIFAPAALQPWPRKIRSDFTKLFEKFAEWALQSEGFAIW